METLSVIIQVVSFKTRGKRVFKMAPIHHHFEMLGWSEQQVTISFWFIGFICGILSIVIGVLQNMFTGKKVLVIGLAKSGKAAIRLLHKLNATITVNEAKEIKDIPEYQQYLDMGIEMVTGSHPTELFERDFDFVIKNPGINYHKPFILRLKERKIPVYTEIELAFQVAKKQHYIGVTGTNGKTTTVTLIDKILKGQYQHVVFQQIGRAHV